MRITGLTTRLLRVESAPRYGVEGIPPGRPPWWEYPLVTIHTDGGVEGYSMGYGNQGTGRAIAHALREVVYHEIVGADPLRIETIWQRLRLRNRHLYTFSDALSGIVDVALWDIAGKIRGVPVADLLGRIRDRVPAYMTGYRFHPKPQDVYDEVRSAIDAGFRGYKLHFWNTPDRDVPCIRAAREAAGPDFPLMQDLSGTYDFIDALRVGRVLDELEFTWLEEPIPDRRMTDLRRLADQLETPILAGETLSLEELDEHIVRRSCDMVRGDVYIKNGITGLMKACLAAERAGMRMEIHTMATPLLDIANLHVNAAAPTGGFAEVIHPVYRFGLVGHPLEPDADGYLTVPSKPGLGVDLDWDWIDDATVEVIETD